MQFLLRKDNGKKLIQEHDMCIWQGGRGWKHRWRGDHCLWEPHGKEKAQSK